jgi:hypothetical protein
VECPEFRQLLLLLREDLREEDIPHRDKIRTAIMKAWYQYYKVLKDELQVSLDLFHPNILFLKMIHTSRHWARSATLLMLGLQETCSLTMR